MEAPNTQNHTHGGVAIIYKSHVPLKFKDADNATDWWEILSEEDKRNHLKSQITGRWIHAELTIGNKTINIINHYFPSHSQNARNIHLTQISTKWINEENLIMIGDWNCVMDINRDIYRTRENSQSQNSNHDVQELHDFYEAHSLIDKYIEAYENCDEDTPIYMTNKTEHTNKDDGTSQVTLKRIDRTYVTNTLSGHTFNLIDYTEDGTTPNYPPLPITTTHLPIGIVIYDPTKPRIKQFKHIWRCNMEGIINDKAIKKIINKKIKKHFNKAEKNQSHSKEWDQMKYAIQLILKNQQKRVHDMEECNKRQDQKIIHDLASSKEEKILAKQNIIDRQKYKARAAAMKARDLNVMEEDRCTKYHFQLNKAKATATQIGALKCQNTGTIYTTQTKIEETMNACWSQVFKERITNEDSIKKIISYIDKTLTNEQSDTLGSPITIEEVKKAIESAKLNKSPGIDGLPSDFYYLFRNDQKGLIVQFMHKVFIQSHQNGILPKSMRRIQIRMLFKKTTDIEKLDPGNYRPISLLNCDYKILSSVLSKRLSPLLQHIIDPTQAGAPGQTMSDPIHTIQALTHYLQKEKERHHNSTTCKHAGAILLLDFAKAFDSVDHQFTFRIMQAMNIHPEFIRYAKLGFTQTTAACIINGKHSKTFPLPGGGRQGDNLYPLVFSLVMQGLAIAIRNQEDLEGNKIQGIQVPHSDIFLTLNQFVDDSGIFIGDNHRRDLDIAYKAITLFCSASGMEINWSKTEAMWIGRYNKNQPFTQTTHNPPIKFTDPQGQYNTILKYLGILVGPGVQLHTGAQKILTQIRNKALIGVNHSTTIKAKILNANANLISQLPPLVQHSPISPTMAKKIVNQIKQSTCGKFPQIPIKHLMTKMEHGSILTLINVNKYIHTLSAKSLVQMINTQTPCTYHFFWAEALHNIAIHHKFRHIDHLLASQWEPQYRFSKASTLNLVVYQALINTKKMGFTSSPQVLSHYHMKQPKPLYGITQTY